MYWFKQLLGFQATKHYDPARIATAPIPPLAPDSDVAIFVFDYDQMDSSYGSQALAAIQQALASSKGTCAFSDGDLEVPAGGLCRVPTLLIKIREQACIIEPIDEANPLANLDSVTHIYGYAAAMWTDSPANIQLLHEQLKATQTPGYLGYIAMREKVGSHPRFLQSIAKQLWLVPGIRFVDGQVVPKTSKYRIR